jgi:hypothetical protein
MPLLSDLVRNIRLSVTGSDVEESGAVVISAAEAGQPTTITNNAGTAIITAADNGDVTIGAGQAVRQVVSTINDVDPNNDTNLANVTSIVNRINSAVSGALTFVKFNSKADFDTFLLQTVIDPSSVLVTDSTPFDYTDTNGVVNTQITWWQGIVTKPTAGDALSTNTLETSDSSTSMSGAEIAAALFAEPDTNNLTDARATVTDTIEATVTAGLAGKVDTVAGQGLSTNNFTNAYKAQLDNAPADINTALDNKVSLINTEEVIYRTTSNAGGTLEFNATDAPANQKRFRINALNSGNLSLTKVADDNFSVLHSQFTQTGLEVFGTISQNGNNVVDVTNSTFANLPADTNAALLGKVDVVVGKELSDNNFTDAEQTKLANLQDTSIQIDTGRAIVTNNSPQAVTLKATTGTVASGIAWQNSGSSYKSAFYRSNTTEDNKLYLRMGNNSDPEALSLVATFTDPADSTLALDVNGNLHAQGDIFAFNGGNIAGADITSTGTALTGNNLIVNSGGTASFSNAGAPSNRRNSKIVHSTTGSLNIELDDNAGTNLYSYEFGYDGDLKLPRYLSLVDSTGDIHRFEPYTQGDGIALRSTVNPPDGDAIFSIVAAVNGMRLRVENNGNIATRNANIKVSTLNDGTGGAFVFHENNRELVSPDIVYLGTSSGDFPLTDLTTQVLRDSKAQRTVLVSVGTQLAVLPTISTINTTNGNYNSGEWFELYNANSGSNITLELPSGYVRMLNNVGNVSSNDIVLSGNTVTRFTAVDGTNFSNFSAKCWMVKTY